MRIGYSTGTCAAAAAGAATQFALTGRAPDTWSILTPAGVRFELPIERPERSEGRVSVGVRKFAGSDPDVTDGMEIRVSIRLTPKNGDADSLVLLGGEGIGQVTKPGLSVPAGGPAINPEPRRMIFSEVKQILPADTGAEITVCAPEGLERAKKTFNARLGILGGISILGTSGLVRPMSEESWLRSLLPQLDVMRAAGREAVVLVPGSLGEKAALGLGLPRQAIAQMSNFVGAMLMGAADRGFREALLLGHPGKLGKLAAGQFDTHSRYSSGAQALKSFARARGCERSILKTIEPMETTEEIAGFLRRQAPAILDNLAATVSRVAETHTCFRLHIATGLISLAGELLAIDPRGRDLVARMKAGVS